MVYCLKCGKETDSTEFFCSQCREKIESEWKKELGFGGGKISVLRQLWSNLPLKVIVLSGFVIVFALVATFLSWVISPKNVEKSIIVVPRTYSGIQEAIDAAGHGDIIEVEPGIYKENINFRGKEIILRSTNPGDDDTVVTTVIDGAEKGPVVTIESGESSGAVLQGFTITSKSGAPVTLEIPYGEGDGNFDGCGGGGILIRNGSAPVVEYNIVTGIDLSRGACGKISAGAGIYIQDSAPSITGNTIAGCKAHQGGGIYILDAAPVLSENYYIENSALWEGGAIWVSNNSSPIFKFEGEIMPDLYEPKNIDIFYQP